MCEMRILVGIEMAQVLISESFLQILLDLGSLGKLFCLSEPQFPH